MLTKLLLNVSQRNNQRTSQTHVELIRVFPPICEPLEVTECEKCRKLFLFSSSNSSLRFNLSNNIYLFCWKIMWHGIVRTWRNFLLFSLLFQFFPEYLEVVSSIFLYLKTSMVNYVWVSRRHRLFERDFE